MFNLPDMVLRYRVMEIELKGMVDHGMNLFQAGKYHCAIGVFERAIYIFQDQLRESEHFVTACYKKGLAEIHLGDHKEAAKSFSIIPPSISLKDGVVPKIHVEKLLKYGHETFDKGEFLSAMNFYKSIDKITSEPQLLEDAKLGRLLIQHKIGKRSLSDLTRHISKDVLLGKAQGLYDRAKEMKANKSYEQSIEKLTLAASICDALPLDSRREISFKINKNLAKMLLKIKKRDEAVKRLSKCFELDRNSYVKFWKTQQSKGMEALSNNPNESLERLTMLSLLTPKLPADTPPSREEVMNAHLELVRMDMNSESYDEVMEHIGSITRYLSAHSYHDEINTLAVELMTHGNTLIEQKNYEFAKQFYSFGIKMIPVKSVTVERDLLLNRSYVNELTGNYVAATNDLKRCVEIAPDSSQAHLRLGSCYHQQKEYIKAHGAFLECFDLSDSAEKVKVMEKILSNIVAIGKDQDKQKMSLPKEANVETINKCILLLNNEGSKTALDAISYIFTQSEFCNHASATNISLEKMIKQRYPPELIEKLIERGADINGVEGSITPLAAALETPDCSNEIMLCLVKKGVRLVNYIPLIPLEPLVHTMVRLCLKLDRLDIIAELYKEMEPNQIDQEGNGALHLLAEMELSPLVVRCLKLLIKRGTIDLKLKNKAGQTAADIIRSRSDEDYKTYEKLFAEQTSKGKKKKKKKVEEIIECIDAPEDNAKKEQKNGSENMKLAEKHAVDHSEAEKKEDEQSTPHATKTIITAHQQARINVQDCIRGFVQVKMEQKENNKGDAGSGATVATNDRLAQVTSEDRPIDTAPADAAEESDDDVDDNDDDDDNDDIIQANYNDGEFKEMTDEFEGLPWDVQCTSEFWKKLKDLKLQGEIKRRILNKIKLLASGEWRPKLAIKLEGSCSSTGIRLYKAKFTKGARMIWEEAIAFSERCSIDQAKNFDERKADTFIYTDVIRLWDFTLNHSEVPRMIERIVQSRIRGQSCTIKKTLKTMKVENSAKKDSNIRFPRVYVSEGVSDQQNQQSVSRRPDAPWDEVFSPSASPNDREFHILKFYALSSAMANSVLQNSEQNYDFPFQVSELEHYIIRLKPVPMASVLLLGRSGTGKTTCCLYRLWSKFKIYWENAATAGPHIPILQRILEDFDSEGEENGTEDDGSNTEHQEDDDIKDQNQNTIKSEASSSKVDNRQKDVMSCGCKNICMCAVAMARANNAAILDQPGSLLRNAYKGAAEGFAELPEDQLHEEDDFDGSGSDISDDKDIYRHLRQLFVTKNKVLCHEVKRNFKDLCNGLPVAKQHVSYESEENVSNLNCINELAYPLFLGSRDLLMALDASLPGKTFFPRDGTGKILTPIAGWGEKESHLAFLPVLDSEGEDDEIAEDQEEDLENAAETQDVRKRKTVSSVKREVTYTVFAHELWPLIEKKFASGYHPSLVWTEFCSFIKGTVEALVSSNGHMSKEEYDSIGRKKAPNFSGNRDVVYEMFKRYRKMCIDTNLFDEFDLLCNVYKRLSNNPIQPWLFDEMYIDETQDFTEAELFLLIRCCQDPNQLFFTGDTAQSIMRGVTFRFSDLRSLFFNARKALNCTKKSTIEVPSQVHQLTYNYRSHKGILDLASSIVDLLGHFFPESFDRLENDVGLFDGPKPVILETSDFSDLAVMLRGARRKTSPIEFGAHQVVLVTSEDSKETLPEELSCALVLTIYEAKGLEFDDVLLYNFFKDSQATKEWRVINTYESNACKAPPQEAPQGADGIGLVSKTESELSFESRPLEFDYNKHKILNSELKQLYTAVTRARVNVWIYDEDRENRAPMFNYFKRVELVEILKMDGGVSDSKFEQGMFAEKSSEADWEERGLFFYKKELWNVAYKCFAKTKNGTMLERCNAHMQAMKAYKMGMEWRERKSGTLKNVHTEYLKATEMYLRCGMGEESVICLRNAKEWELLGELCEHLKRYHEAGRYYAKAVGKSRDGTAVMASECYEKVGDYRSATDILYKNKCFRECIDVFKRYEAQRSSGHRRLLQPPRSTLNAEKVVKEAAEICIKKRDFDTLKGFLTELPLEKQLEYLKRKRGCVDLYLEVLLENGGEEEAARIYMNKGKYLKASSCTKDDRTKGICLLEQARQFHLNNSGQAEFKRAALSYLKNCIPLLAADHANLADAYFLIGTINDDTKSILEATRCYKDAGNMIGALICDQILWKKEGIETADIFETLSKVYQQGGNLVVSMKNAVMLQRFFGIEKVIGKGDIHYLINDRKLLDRLQILKTSDVKGSDLKTHFDKLDENTGNALITRAILRIADEATAKLMEVYNVEINNSTVCQEYLRGIKHDNCTLLHQVPNGELAKKRFNAYFCIMQLQGVVRQFVKILQKSETLREDIMRVKSLRDCRESGTEMIDTCNAFYTDLIEYTRYLKTREFHGLQLARSLPQMSYVKDQILWCISALWERADEEGRYGDVNLFLKVFHISSFAGLSFVQDEINTMKAGLSNRYSTLKNLPRNEACVLDKKFRTGYHTFHTIFSDSKIWLHDSGAMIESIHHLFREAIPVTVLKWKEIPPPSLINMVMLLEFNISLCIVSLSRTHKSRNAEIYLPNFYIEGLQFWSRIYRDCNKSQYSAVDSISYVSYKLGNGYVINLIKVAIDLILMKEYEKLNLFREAFDGRNMMTQASERFLLLVLVLLTNYDLYSWNNDTIKNGFIDQLHLYAKQSKNIPGCLPEALQRAANIKKPQDAFLILEFILQKSGNEVVCHTWKSFSGAHFQQMETQSSKGEQPKGSRKAVLRPSADKKPSANQKQPSAFPKQPKTPMRQATAQSLPSQRQPSSQQSFALPKEKSPTILMKPANPKQSITQEPPTTKQQPNQRPSIVLDEKVKVIVRPPFEEKPPVDSFAVSEDRPRRTIQNFKRFLAQRNTGHRQQDTTTALNKKTAPSNENESFSIEAIKGAPLPQDINVPVFGSDPLLSEETSQFGWKDTAGDSSRDANSSTSGEEASGFTTFKAHSVDMQRQLSEDFAMGEESYEIRDSSAELKANEKKWHERQIAAYRIQRWWRLISTKLEDGPEPKTVKSADEERIENHISKYVVDLKCKPCGRSLQTKESLNQHILHDTEHERNVQEYDSFARYQKSIVEPWSKRADALLDKGFQQETVSSTKMAEPIHSCLGGIAVAVSFIDGSGRWTDMTDLKRHVVDLQRACQKVEDELQRIDGDNYDDHYRPGDEHVTDDDFVLVTNKKKQNRKSGMPKKNLKGGKEPGRGR